MNVFITGATGFVGQALVQRLLADEHRIVALSRSPSRVSATLGPDVVAVDANDELAFDRAVAAADVVVNLAGENLFGGRWTTERKRALEESRIDLTERLVGAMRRAQKPPRVLVSTSAVNYYPDSPSPSDAPRVETSPPADHFLGSLCQRWEAAARQAETLGTRVVILRLGVVLGSEGGMMQKVLPIFRLGLGGRLGSGHQPFSWIHRRDLVDMILLGMTDSRWSGPINAVAPNTVDNREFTRTLAETLSRPAVIPVPAMAIRLAFGEAAQVVLGGVNVRPERAERLGYQFELPTLSAALRSIIHPPDAPTFGTPDSSAPVDAPHLLEQVTVIDAPISDVFAFFSKAENLGVLTPGWMSFEILDTPETMTEDAIINYRIALGPIPMRWRTRIRKWEPGRRFVDEQEKGPYSIWWHEHAFEARGNQTVMRDRVYYKAPLGPIGRVVNAINIRGTLRRIFSYRSAMIRLRFPRRSVDEAVLPASA